MITDADLHDMETRATVSRDDLDCPCGGEMQGANDPDGTRDGVNYLQCEDCGYNTKTEVVLIAEVRLLRERRYLPIGCADCGRERLLWAPTTNEVACEKCGRRWPEP